MDEHIPSQIVACIKNYPELELLMLFGSRARGKATENSDWDFGYIATKAFDSEAFFSDLTLAVKSDKVDLANLSKASGLLRFRVAKDGKVVYEKRDGQYEKFWLQAVHFWCDAGPIIRAEYEALLRRQACPP
jgi:predicted nucleotidyltransferase